jgi:hypothetical protein
MNGSPGSTDDRDRQAEYERLRVILEDAQSRAGMAHDSLEIRALADTITLAVASSRQAWEFAHREG